MGYAGGLEMRVGKMYIVGQPQNDEYGMRWVRGRGRCGREVACCKESRWSALATGQATHDYEGWGAEA